MRCKIKINNRIRNGRRLTLTANGFYEICLQIFLIIALNQVFRNNSILWFGSIGLLFAGLAVAYGGRLYVKVTPFKIWWALFMAAVLLSAILAIDRHNTIKIFNALLVMIFVTSVIELKLNSTKDLEHFFAIYLIAVIAMMLYIFLTVDLVQFHLAQTGHGNVGVWNGNDVALKIDITVPIVLYFCNKNKKKTKTILLYSYLLIALAMVMIIGSRKGIVMYILALCGYIMLKKTRRFIRNSLLVITILYLSFLAIMEIPILYELIGWRIDGLLALRTGGSGADHSAALRMYYIQTGLSAFMRSPFLGYGLGNYVVLNSILTGVAEYSHNNVIEILVGMGAIGFVAYYWFYFYLIIQYLKRIPRNSNTLLTSVIFIDFMLFLILHMGFVAYFDFTQWMLLVLMASAMRISRQSEKEGIHKNE